MSRYTEVTNPLKDIITNNMIEIKTTLLNIMNNGPTKELDDNTCVSYMDEEVALRLEACYEKVIRAIEKLEWYMKIYPDKTAIEADKKLCSDTRALLEMINLEENLLPPNTKN